MSDRVSRELLLGFIRIHILHHAAEDGVFGLGLIEELARHGYRLSPGTVYPLLHDMAAAGLLQAEGRQVGGRRRYYYRATADGQRVLAEARDKLRELVAEVLVDTGPSSVLPPPAEDKGE
jgi:DNA-binding PadR family transcriptional regulator